MSRLAWVIGSSGLLGTAIRRSISARADWELAVRGGLPWSEPTALRTDARASMIELVRKAEQEDHEWVVIWAGGSVVTSSSSEAVANELAQFRIVVGEIVDIASASKSNGAFFFASSAGGVYAGSKDPPFTELTPVVPLSHYGQFKLDAEDAASTAFSAVGVPSVAGRISNIYGPGQRLDKPQGLISHLARAQFSPAPVSIYVSLDTLRDYLYVYDCAELVLDAVERAIREHVDGAAGAVTTKNLISGRAVTISALLGVLRSLVKAHPHVMLGSSPSAALQAVDLRLSSVVWTELDQRTLTTLDVGIDATLRDVLGRIQASGRR